VRRDVRHSPACGVLRSRGASAWRFCAFLALILLAAAAAWRVARHAVGPSTGGVARTLSAPLIFRRGNGAEPESLDVHRARSEAALTILRDLYEGLTAIGADGTPVPAAADHCEVSSDGKTYRFHLRADARWSNGDAVVADDFTAAWRRLVDPHTGAQYAGILGPVRGAAEITAGNAAPGTLGVHSDDPATLVVELARPTPYFLSLLAHPATFPINRGSLASNGRAFAKPGVMVSNGAFVLTRWDFGSHLVAVRNPRYWNNAATRVDQVEYYSFADADTELKAFRTGQVDVTSTIPAAQVPWIKAHLGDVLHVAPQLAVYYLGLNLRKPPFDKSRELRQALSLVIDRERLVQSVTGAGEGPAYTFVPPQVHGYSPPVPEYAAWPMAQRIARARQLLRNAGPVPVIELRYNSGELHGRIAVAVAQMWKQSLGLDTRLRAEEFKVLLQDIDRNDVTVFRASWLGDFDDAYGFLQVMQSGFGINLPHYANADYDDLLERAANEGDISRRRELLQRAEALMLADQPLIPLYFYVSKHLVNAHIRGWQDNAMNVVYSKNLAKVPAGVGE
jgi:oligopeptide transport system substrate-binding protein